MKGQERDVSLLTRERKRKGAKKVRGGDGEVEKFEVRDIRVFSH